MADAYIQVPQDQTGKKVATQEVTRGDMVSTTANTQTVEMQQFALDETQYSNLISELKQLILEVKDLKLKLLSAFR